MCPVKPKLSTVWPFIEKQLSTPDLDIVKLKIRGKNVNSIYMSLYRLKDHYTVSKISCEVLPCFFPKGLFSSFLKIPVAAADWVLPTDGHTLASPTPGHLLQAPCLTVDTRVGYMSKSW